MTSIFSRLTPGDIKRAAHALSYAATPVRLDTPTPAPPPKPPVMRSIVGGVVVNLHAGLRSFRSQEAVLQAEIDAKNEQLRQTRASIRSLEIGLAEISMDPALNEEERAAAMEHVEVAAADAMAREIKHFSDMTRQLKEEGRVTSPIDPRDAAAARAFSEEMDRVEEHARELMMDEERGND